MPAQSAIDDLIADFELLDDWEQRFAYVIDLGKKLPPMDPADVNESTRVHGCQATVHMTARLSDDAPPRLRLSAQSDAHLVNGLIAILLMLFDDKTPEQVLATDVSGVLESLQLEEHLSPTRRNGLHAMLERIGELARAHH